MIGGVFGVFCHYAWTRRERGVTVGLRVGSWVVGVAAVATGRGGLYLGAWRAP